MTRREFNAATFRAVGDDRAEIIRPLNQPETAALLGVATQAVEQVETRALAKLSIALFGDQHIRTRDQAAMVRRVVRYGKRRERNGGKAI